MNEEAIAQPEFMEISYNQIGRSEEADNEAYESDNLTSSPNNSLITSEINESDNDEDKKSDSSEDSDSNSIKWNDDVHTWSSEWLMGYNVNPRATLPRTQLENPLDYSNLLFDDNVIKYLIEQTKVYSEQFFSQKPDKKENSYYKRWTSEKTLLEMRAFLASLIY